MEDETAVAETNETTVEPRAGAGPRIVAVILALVIAFGAAVAILALAEIMGWTPCVEVNRHPENFPGATDCFDGSSKRQILLLVLGWAGTALVVAGLLLTLAFAIRGRGGRLAIFTTVGGAALLGLSYLAGVI